MSVKTKARVLALLGVGWMIGTFASDVISPSAASKAPKSGVDYERLSTFANVLAIVEDLYVEDVDPEPMIADAINGVLHALDPHSHYVSPNDYEKQQKRSKREYGGLGIEVSMQDGYVKVGYANKGAPAYRAGIRAGDLITHVEGKSVKGKSLNDAVSGMRGLAGDPIKITVKTPGQAPRELTIVREVVQGRVVRHRLYKGFGYIYLETFNNEHVARDLAEAIELLTTEAGHKLPGIILDIRSNRGGLLDQSVDVSGHFLDGGEVVSVRGREGGENDRYHAKRGEIAAGIPVVVLINGESASASEIVAGALQDRGRAIILGSPSFGKGSVQSVYPLKGGALRLTTARYFTPSGRSIQGLGITPDIWVEAFSKEDLAKVDIVRESSLPHALNSIIRAQEGENIKTKKTKPQYPPKDWPKGEDYQLSRAVEVLKSPDFAKRLRDYQN